MASGNFNLTTWYAKRIMGDTGASTASDALLQTGTGVTGDIWILHRTDRTAKLYGVKYAYDSTNGHDKIEFYGKNSSDNATAWVQLDTGDASFIGNVDIGGTLNVVGNTTLDGTLTTGGTITAGSLTTASDINIIAASTAGTISFYSNNSTGNRGIWIGSPNTGIDGAAAISVSSTNQIYFRGSAITLKYLKDSATTPANIVRGTAPSGDQYRQIDIVDSAGSRMGWISSKLVSGEKTTYIQFYTIKPVTDQTLYRGFEIKSTDTDPAEMLINANTILNVSSTQASSDKTNGALIVAGGVGIGGAVYTGSTLNTAASIYAGTTSDTSERNVCVRSGAGQIYLYSAGSSGGNRGIYGYDADNNDGVVLVVNQDNNISDFANLVCNLWFINENGCKYKMPRKKSDGGGWAYAPIGFMGNDNTAFMRIGAYGSADTCTYMYLGAGDYNERTHIRITPAGTLILPNNTNAAGTTANAVALIVGGTQTEQHIEIDSNEILSKSNDTTPGVLYLQDGSGSVQVAGSGGLRMSSGHLYLQNVASTSTNTTTQIVFTNSDRSTQYIALSATTSGQFVINPSTSSTTGQIILYPGGTSFFTNNTDVSASSQGSLVVSGGQMVGGKLFVGTTTKQDTSYTLYDQGTAYINGILYANSSINLLGTTATTAVINFSRAGINYINIPTSGSLGFSINGSVGTNIQVQILSGCLSCYANKRSALGSSNTRWSTLYSGSGDFDEAVSISGLLTVNNLIKSTYNSNTVTIGSQNANFCHIYNSAAIPFIFNYTIACTGQGSFTDTTASLGTTSYPFHRLILGGSTNATMTADSTNPRITFQEGTGTQPVHLIYTDYNSYREPAGLKIVGGTSATPAWLEVEGQVYAAGFNGPLDGNASTATKATQDGSGNTITSYYCTLSTAQTITAKKTFTGVPVIKTSNGTPQIDWHSGDSTAARGGILYLSMSSTNSIYRCNQFVLRQYSYNSSTGATLTYYENYVLPEVAAGKTGNTTYTILTTKLWPYNRSSTGAFITVQQNSVTCGTWQLQTLGPANTEGWSTIYLGNSTASTAANNASGRIYLYNKNGGSAYLDGQYVSLGGTNRNAIRSTYFYATQVWNAVWNDYAECRNVETDERGYCVTETASGKMIKTTERLQAGCKITSDTFGTCMGETKEAKTPIAVSGRVLVYPYRARKEYPLGAAVCSAPGGTIDIMTRDEIMLYPERIVGTVSEIPKYETWSGGDQDGMNDVKVNGRIWIYVR